MAVQLDLGGTGGSGGANIPRDTQSRIFEDTFDRPDANTLGTAWGHTWAMADIPFTATNRPRPYDAAINPRINNGRCQYWVRRPQGDLGFCWSITFPWPLAWLGQGLFSQFAEMEVEQWNSTGGIGLYVGVLFSCAYGSIDPGVYDDPGEVIGQYGLYWGGNDIAGQAVFGGNPSATGRSFGANRALAGLQFPFISGTQGPIPTPPFTMRIEARVVPDGWHIEQFVNGESMTFFDDTRPGKHILQGIPCMAVSTGEDDLTDPSNLIQISRFTAGAL